MKFNYMVTLEFPRTLYTRNGSEVTVDVIRQFIYNRKNKESALRAFGSVKNLAVLRKQGFNISRAEFKAFRNAINITRI